MQVVDFPACKARDGWDVNETRALSAFAEAVVRKGQASSWAIGATENGDPQLYLTGPEPEFDCILCLSRLGRLYLLEDGEGRVLGEYASGPALAEAARANLSTRHYRLAVRIVIAWTAAREMIEDKLEPMTGEPAQAVLHFAPQLAALA